MCSCHKARTYATRHIIELLSHLPLSTAAARPRRGLLSITVGEKGTARRTYGRHRTEQNVPEGGEYRPVDATLRHVLSAEHCR